MRDNLITEYESLHNYCSYRTGGRAKYFSMPQTAQELIDVITWANAMKVPHEVIGYGTNILVSDKGYDGAVICMRDFEKWCVRKDNNIIAGAGAQLYDMVRYAGDEALGGVENLAGIPGSVGGAVRMNAGAFDTEIKDVITRINVLAYGQNGLETQVVKTADAGFGYRKADGLVEKIVLAAEFTLTPSDCGALNIARKEILVRRAAKQPLNMPSCGSVFKRPAEGYAGELIEKSGLKGFSIGGAQVSEKHANFIVNTGNATSADIYKLIQLVKAAVYKNTGVLLEEEVRYIGEFV